MLGLQLVGTIVLAAMLALLGRWPTLSLDQLPLALALSITGVVGILLLYRGLALGPIAVVSPIGAAYVAVAVLLVVGLLGERLSPGQAIGIGVTFFGILLTATDGRSLATALGRPLPGVWFALVAMLTLGGWSAVMAYGTRSQDGLGLILLQRVIGATVLVVVLAARGDLAGRLDRPTAGLVAASGSLDTLANVLFVLGVQSGSAAIVATASGVYPMVTTVLAIVLLRERLAPNQVLGVVVLLGGLVALGAAGP